MAGSNEVAMTREELAEVFEIISGRQPDLDSDEWPFEMLENLSREQILAIYLKKAKTERDATAEQRIMAALSE